ncbi:MAG: tRNA (adenosine(37)-N6)-dimethylallyltransferase MiaA [Planctomycetia bacterium]|nr:tRNA (adenosine(37)-N6)-dimethylallyltransferase MiaA [Planctomycetia bacterium]
MRFPSELLRCCWFLAGPTASGKSEVAVELAERIQTQFGSAAEIVSLDSMTLYRRMNIGTAKPSAQQLARVPHHLFDILEPSQDFSVAEYLTAAEQCCREIVAREHIPLFVGGTGLYLRSLLRGVFAGPPANEAIRTRLEAAVERDGKESLFARLQQVDPPTAARLHPNDVRRVIRAIEVSEITGQPMSTQHQEEPLPVSERSRHVYWLEPPRDWLYRRINDRTTAMLAAGWLDEVQSLLNEPLPLGLTASQALGYHELIEHRQGRLTLEDAVTQIQTRTRQFAKRQHTWFRNLEECFAVPITGLEDAAGIAELVLKAAATS